MDKRIIKRVLLYVGLFFLATYLGFVFEYALTGI